MTDKPKGHEFEPRVDLANGESITVIRYTCGTCGASRVVRRSVGLELAAFRCLCGALIELDS